MGPVRTMVIVLLATGCGKPADSDEAVDTDVSGDADTDADADTDTDSDADTDGDTDTGADSDTDGDVPDADGDGHTEDAGDCDDADPLVFPGADEICDGADNDCDSLVDDDDPDFTGAITSYTDADGDGFGDPATETTACSATGVTDGTDCDDTRADVHPGHAEVCGDGAVNDCDGTYGDAVDACDPIDLASSEAEYQGVNFEDQVGRVVRNVGDVDGDGQIDILIGAPHYDLATGRGAPGRAYFVYGGDTGAVDLATADAELVGQKNYDSAGNSVAPAGDIDGDGTRDLLVAAYAHEEGTLVDSGAVYLLNSGVSGTMDLGTADAILHGSDRNGGAGFGLDGDGDVNGDGSPDFVVGAYGASSGAGVVYVYMSAPSGTSNLSSTADVVLTGPSAYGYAGAAVSIAGDATGDGIDDLLVGAYADSSVGTYSGAIYLVAGAEDLASDSLSSATAILQGEAAYDYAGYALDFAGDFDDDGYDDLVIGAHSEHTVGVFAGAAYVVSGTASGTVSLNTAMLKVLGEAAYDTAGTSVSAAGDVNGDGTADVMVGAPQTNVGATYTGTVYVVLGGTTGTMSLGVAGARIDGQNKAEYVGSAVDQAGDVDGDGLDDLLVGALGVNHALGQEGSVYVVLSPAI
jgi:hypothetical protein